MGAWIEIIGAWHLQYIHSVAPFMGAWIEICPSSGLLKNIFVAPFMGAWIEILLRYNSHNAHMRRSLHGSVD